MRRTPGLIALVVVLAACGGGTDWNAAHSSSPQPANLSKSSKSAHPDSSASTAAAEKPYVDAMVASTQSEGPTIVSMQVIRCTAAALVHGYGVEAFVSAGITRNALAKPHSSLDSLPAPSDDQVTAIGTALQKCTFSNFAASAIARELDSADAATVTCLTRRLDTDLGARRFLVLAGLGRKQDLLATHSLVGVVADCIDLPSLVLDAARVHIDAGTRACLLDALKGSDAALKDFLALRLAGTDGETAVQSLETLGISINQCRPGAHTGFTVPSG